MSLKRKIIMLLFQIVSMKSYTEKLTVKNKQAAGTITVSLIAYIMHSNLMFDINEEHVPSVIFQCILQIVAEEMNESNEIVQLIFHGKSLDKKVLFSLQLLRYWPAICLVVTLTLSTPFLQDLLGKSDPYLVISKQLPDGTKVAVHKTEVYNIYNHLCDLWHALEMQPTLQYDIIIF